MDRHSFLGSIELGYALTATGFAVLALAQGFALAAVLLVGRATGLIMPTFISIPLDVAPATAAASPPARS